ncbi:alpha,alpha-trehalase TreF [Spirosoma soli]|uniref:Alpha,alpha-trehalase TreF n=1 Tax=Spirosoma soli TaxID=1770529 RepID=A0ABW5M7B5_9BACT
MAQLTRPQSPDELFGNLFPDVQLSKIFPDSKTFVDCVPKLAPADLVALYEAEKVKPEFDLRAFVDTYFILPHRPASDYVSDTSLSTTEHVNQLWDHLTRPADPSVDGSSRVPLPYPYIVPGGRFREIFYWDSYFTMLGLKQSGRVDLIRSMINNFAYLVDEFGFVPNGNRSYFLTRSQPPFFALMVQLLAKIDSTSPDESNALVTYLPQLQREHEFWMSCQEELSADTPIRQRVVRLLNGSILNRYWDDMTTPRPEAYLAEYQLAEEAKRIGVDTNALHHHLRAACESGWDFSSRWFTETNTLVTSHAADIVPVDLNCVLYFLETTLQQAYELANKPEKAEALNKLATARKQSIQNTFWNDETGFFHDYDTITNQKTSALTLASVFPMFFGIATPEQAGCIHERLKADFLQAGGWVTTLVQSGQQWDWPNGWAPLQWIVYKGLMNYGFVETAHEGRDRWLALNDKVFKATGKMTEKYNVVDAALTTGGGKYPNQDGFGWTNGVYLALFSERTKE